MNVELNIKHEDKCKMFEFSNIFAYICTVLTGYERLVT